MLTKIRRWLAYKLSSIVWRIAPPEDAAFWKEAFIRGGKSVIEEWQPD